MNIVEWFWPCKENFMINNFCFDTSNILICSATLRFLLNMRVITCNISIILFFSCYHVFANFNYHIHSSMSNFTVPLVLFACNFTLPG
jgi:hypothetical protein